METMPLAKLLNGRYKNKERPIEQSAGGSMPKTREKYLVAGVDVYHIRNRNELRVAKCLAELIERKGLDDIDPELIKDAYALSLNKLQSRYVQQGTIVLRDPVSRDVLEEVISKALLHVLKNPKD